MAMFRRKSDTAPAKPEAYEFFDDEEWEFFYGHVRTGARRLRLHVTDFSAQAIEVARLGTISLDRPAMLCKEEPRAAWQPMVEIYLQSCIDATSATGDDTAVTAEQLRIRLVPDDYGTPEHRRATIHKGLADGVLAMLAFDFPNAVRMAGPDDLDVLGMSAAEAFRTGWTQTHQAESPDSIQVEEFEGIPVAILTGESHYVASLVPYLGTFIDIGPSGALVGIPVRNTILAHPIVDVGATRAVERMVNITRATHQSGDGPVSPQLFWWRETGLTLLPHREGDGTLQFVPPDSFVELLDSLA